MHKWRFFRAGGVEQVVLSSAEDVAHLDELDLKLWIALAMPVKGVHLDPRTAALLDVDGDERIRAKEVLDAVRFVRDALVDLEGLFQGSAEVPLAKIRDAELARTATRVANEGRAGSDVVSLDHVSDAEKRFSAMRFNGDGVITKETPADEELASVVAHVMATFGAVTDRSGHFGIDAEKISGFLSDAQSLSAWLSAGATEEERPLGDRTEAGAKLLRDLAPKLEDYFTRVRLHAFDPRVAEAAHGTETDFSVLVGRDLAASTTELRRFPLARVTNEPVLVFEGPVNPAFASDLRALRDEVVRPILGATTNALTEDGFRTLLARFAPYEAWRGAKPPTKLDALPPERVRALADGKACAALAELVARDLAEKSEYDRIEAVERLVRYHRDLVPLLRNFVSFEDFYARKHAAFQAGTLYLDGRACSLCVDVSDASKHATLAAHAETYLAYVDCVRRGGAKRTIVAAFTSGDSDNLMVGRNGVFYDRDGNDWDATITKVVENPISIREAFFSPYKKFVRFVETQVGRRASAADEEVQTLARAQVDGALARPEPQAATRPKPKFDVGTIAALGVAVGGIGAMVTGLFSAFFGLGRWMPLGLLGVILMISGPSMLLAYLKLRRRNLGPLLDASGWAVNGLAQINVPFGSALTSVAALPPNTERRLVDPYAYEPQRWRYVFVLLLVAAVAAWGLGTFDRYLPPGLRAPSRTVAPATPVPTSPATPGP